MKCVAWGSGSAQSSQQTAKGVRGVCLDSKSQIHDRPHPKGNADPTPPPHSCSPNLFSPLHFPLDTGKVFKIFHVHECKRIPGFSLSMSLSISSPDHLGNCAGASLSQGSEQQQGSGQILSSIIQRFIDSLSNAGNKANPHSINLISSTWCNLDYKSSESSWCCYHNMLQKG